MAPENPSLIQDLPSSSHIYPPPAPLVLIHDGGGTIYSYHCLGPLSRPVYGISNPHYGTALSWTGGIRQMARHYLALIKTILAKGNIILGGWSLGGLISLQIARLLAEDKDLHVLGIVMIDSIYPKTADGAAQRIVPHAVEWSSTTRPETKAAVQRCFEEAGRMVREWKLPTWEAREDDGEEEEKAYDPVMPGKDVRPPPVWLLRAREPVPTLEEGGVSRVDTYRGERRLGWEGYRRGMVVKVEDIPGHHFNIFSFEDGRIDAVTEKLRKVCGEIEERARARK